VTGSTYSTDFPRGNAFQTQLKGLYNAFIAKLNTGGSNLVYSTYLGGSTQDAGFGIGVDAQGNAFVGGATQSADFPTTNAIQGALGGEAPRGDAFVAEFGPDGSVIYSTYFGGSDASCYGIAVDKEDNAYVAGECAGFDFPTWSDLNSGGGYSDAFVVKIGAAIPVLNITAIARETNYVRVTWIMPGGTNYALQADTPGAAGGLSFNFQDISPMIAVPDGYALETNFLDAVAITNQSARYYRVRVAP
jgi:hypothetical protein